MDNQAKYLSRQVNGGGYSNVTAGNLQARSSSSFAEQVNLSRNTAHDTVARLARLADKLCGAVPAEAEALSGTPLGSGGGIFGSVESDAQGIQRLMNEASSYLTRIENALPITD